MIPLKVHLKYHETSESTIEVNRKEASKDEVIPLQPLMTYLKEKDEEK